VLNRFDWVTICSPILLAVLGAWISVRPPAKKYHLHTAIALILLGALAGGSALYQIRQTRKSDETTRATERSDKEGLQVTITGLRNQITVLSETSIPTLIGDVRGLQPHKAVPANLSLRFVYPNEVSLIVDNAQGAGLADRPKYWAQLIDLDNIHGNYLQIPVSMGDYIRSGDFLGPAQFMGLPAVKSLVKPGDRVFGSVSVSCPTCIKTRTYWLYVKVGEGGWYEEQQGSGKTIGSLQAAETIAPNFDAYAAIFAPPDKRISIQ